ncbi:reducing polyketide synthase DEP5 [Colletotrichum liriopes]|uniref:Reducing polyketide synthase DEP5 n=1 Tax=Colletotrichum liriopes TaxID=708192 RepID=A0AA37GD33_9PEZI|nr:reducing polyketide synthase DEP5 [Colletotrichum liriopes]
MPMMIEEAELGLEPIAIVGMACRLPGSVDSASKFWDILREKKSVRTPRVPSSRFNIDAHYHPDLSRPGSFSAMGGYFLDEDPVDFDPSFFNITPVEAQWLDPQQRKVLEVCYEALENAGVSLEAAAGSNTGVYLATFTSDYQQISIFERDFRHNYAATGVDPGIISNRINNTFNLHGPSCVINTACSSSVYAIHNACHALRSRDCTAALAVGSNLVMIVDQHMNTAKLGVLSPTSECHTFDERADGYGRAEGIGALYLKRLSDAIRDKDVIRGVIRSSAVNTNGKVEGMGITYPNALGQEKVLRHAYKRANLNPSKTAYLECHGTGTPTGDPIEVRAVSLGMNDTRSIGKPLLLGAVKASIGHSEAASGIFATMKAALMTENAQIPGVYGFEKLNPNIKAKEWNVEIVRDLMPWPAEFDVRRASVSSFGYGGTNAHLVIESIESICPWYEHGKPIATAKYDYGKIDRPLLVTMSAHDQKTLRRNIQAHSQIAGDYYLVDMAYSLNERRTQLNSRGYVLVDDGHQAEAFNTAKFSYGTKLGRPARIGFIMTGQGAQWARMGYEAMRIFPQFAETLHALDRVLKQIEPVPTWSLTTILEQTAESSRVGEAEISQPVCTAIQIAIIDLFASWGIEPEVTVGHSSGEIAAAYASGRISAPEAILAAYFRGYAVARAAPVGTMLAVGVGAADMPEYLSSLDEDVTSRLAIACENSPGSVTMSGSEEDITLLKEKLDQSSIFARQLKTGKAYHSRQMDAVAPLYAELYVKASQSLDETQLSWRRPLVGMISSVTGTKLDDSELSISYWCDNLRNRVLFDKAVTTLGDKTSDFSEVNILIEIGPHAALGGPTKQIIQSNGYDMQYVPSLMRNADSAHSLLRTVGELYNRGLKIEFSLVNSISSSSLDSPASGKHSKKPRYLPDLPHYQWNYERKYWYQPRAMQELRESKFPRHDVLGRRIFGLSTNSSTWKNILRQRDVAWFADHILGTEVVFPAAGHVSLAIEALHQQLDQEPEAASGVRLRDISLHKALIVPENDEGVEVHTRLEKLAAGGWYSFTVESFEGGSWIQHSNGKIQKLPDESTQDEEPSSPYKASQLHRQVSGKRWYRSFNRVGFRYGTNFQTMDNVRANGKDRVASAGIQVRTECPAMENESRYLMHPSTIDGCLHVVIAAVHRGQHKEMPWGVIPVEIEEMTVKFPGEQDVNREGKCTAWVERALDRQFEGKVQLFSESGRCILDIKNWKFVTYDSAVPPSLAEPGPKKPYSNVTWVPATTEVDDEPEARVKDGRITVFHVSKESSFASALNVSAVPLTFANSTLVDDSQLHSIVIDDADGSVLTTGLTEETWGAIQKILQSGHPIVWVTRGANSGLSAASGTPQGFLRTVRSEALSSRINLIDADVDATTEQVAAFVQQRLAALSSAVESSGDLEHWLTKDRVLVPRIDTSDRLNDLMFGQKEATVDTLSADKSYKGIIVGDEVIFETPASESPVELAPLEAEIQVSFTTISKEILASRHLGRARIVTGTVTRIGGDLDAGLIGQAVVAFTQKTLETRVVATVFVTLPDSSQDIASFLPHFVKAVDATLLATSHGVAPGDHVLLLPTASPLFEHAVVELGVHLGFSVSKVPKDTAKAQSLLEASKGRITVIAAAPSPLITDFWLAMPRGARLVLSDVSVKDYALDMRPFARGVGLHVCDLSEAFKVDQPALQVTLQTSIDLVKRVTLPASHSLNVEELSDLDNARRVIAETGADVLSFKYGEDKIKSRTTPEPVRFSGDSIYLLIGCLGGLGRSLTTWMLERGCRNFVFLSRSGTAKPEAADVVQHLQEAGANVDVFCVDASDETAVANVVSTVSAQGSIKGVVHAAMVLKDGLYQTMTFSAYQTAMRPKVEAALVLDKVLGDMPLDFFIMTSSISAVLGNQGQANYAAANSFLDFLALQRRRQGRVACSLALPMVEDVGVVAENTSIADSLARKMPFGIDEREMLSGFEAAIIQGASSGKEVQLGDVQLILGLEPPAMLVAMEGLDLSDAFWYKDERMRPILEELEALAALMGKTGGGGGLESFTSKLVGLSADESLLAIGSHIMERSARILGAQAEDFQYESISVSSHGIDSMIGVELQSWLFKEFGVQVSIQIISGTNTTFAGLARIISEHLGIV